MNVSKQGEKICPPMQWTAGDQVGFTTGSQWEAVTSDTPQMNAASESKVPTSILNL
jgi:hypothetical protein